MFDWDDQDLANIIWGDNTEADDHIVPYPEDIENKNIPDYGDKDKQSLNGEHAFSKAVERTLSNSRFFSEGGRGEKDDDVSASGIDMDSQPNLPSFAASSENDDNAIAKKTERDIGPEVSGNQNEDKELGELVGNSWANIGSFDDLDRIFSNDELDGHTSLGNADALWSPSKELISGTAKSSSAALGSTSWGFGDLGSSSSLIEHNSEFLHNEYPSATNSRERTGTTSSYTGCMRDRLVEQQKYTAGTSPLIETKTDYSLTGETAMASHGPAEIADASNNSSDKDAWSKIQQKHGQVVDEVCGSRLSRDVYDTWLSSAATVPQYDRRGGPATVQSFQAPVHIKQQLPHESRPMSYQNFSNPYAAPYAYSNFPPQNSATQMLRPCEKERQSIQAGSEIRQGDVITARPLKMTPQEKIEKLRRRQQMRAMLAIQKQQKQLGHQATVNYPLSQSSYQDDHIMLTAKPDLQADGSLNTLPCYDPGSPNKLDEHSTISDVDEYSAEDTALFQLQDIIARLDVKIRLCIKDSLYRLAESAMQRHFVSNATTANRTRACDPDVAKEEKSSHHRIAGNANDEAETNHIDRTIAHLLFHRPFKLSHQHETPESSTSNRFSVEQETAVNSLPSSLLNNSSENDFNLPSTESNTQRPFVGTHQEDVPTGMSKTETKVNSQMEQNIADPAN